MISYRTRKNRKKVIFSSYDDIYNPFYAGGGAHSIHEIAKRLASQFAVTVLTGKYKGATSTVIDNVTYKRIGLSFVGPRIGQLLFSALLPFYMRKEQFDVWIESFTPPFSTSCLQLFTKRPVIGLVHTLAGEDMERKYKLPFRFFERLGLKTYRYFIVLTDVFQSKIEQVNSKAKFALIPNGVASVTENRKKKMKQPYLLFLGRIEINQKGLDLLIEAYKQLVAKIDVPLVIAGAGVLSDQKTLEKQIREANLTDKIHVVGRVSGKRKLSFLQHCSAVVVPSRFETFGSVALEAMAHGKPLVHFAIEGLRWIPNNCSIKVRPFDNKGLSDAMESVLTNKQLSQRLSSAAKRAVKPYSWEVLSQKYSTIVYDILKEYE